MYFGWRGVLSQDHGVVVTKLPPAVIAGRRVKTVVVPGRSGALHIEDGAWDEVLLTIECYLPYEQGATVSGIETIAAWLQGQDWLTLSNRPGRRFRARLADAVTMAPLMEGFEDRVFALPFLAEPFAYEAAPTVLTSAEPFILTNPGTVFSEPLIELTATGDASLTIGDKTISIDGAPGTVMIDVPAGLIYAGDMNLSGSASTEDWPLTIPTGECAVSWTGGVSRVKIQPNWRWL
jgi:phage-related protein